MDVRRIVSYLHSGDCCHVAFTHLPERLPTSPHTHDFHEIFWIRNGGCRHLINSEEQFLRAGHMQFVQPGDSHRFQGISGDAGLVNIALPNDYVKRLSQRYGDSLQGIGFSRNTPQPSITTLTAEFMETANAIAHELRHAPQDTMRLDYMILHLLRATRSSPDNQQTSLAPNWLQRAVRSAEHPDVFRLGAAGLVKAAGKGHEHVCRMTKRYYGKTPSEMMNTRRCRYAAVQLAEGKMPIAEISELCGFESSSHFYRLFKQHYAQTPKQYRMFRQVNLL